MKTFAELRTETALWLDDPKFTRFDATMLGTLLNMAYPMVVAIVESSGRLWNLAQRPITITLDPVFQEYVVEDTFTPREGVRRVVEVRRVVGTTRPQVPFFVMTEVDRSGGLAMYPDLWGNPVNPGAVLYRGNYGGPAGAQTPAVTPYQAAWFLRFPRFPPAGTIEVAYIPIVEKLLTDEQVPRMVPGDYHHVIAMRAALIGKGTEERTSSTLPAEYQEQTRLLLGECASLTAGRSQRM